MEPEAIGSWLKSPGYIRPSREASLSVTLGFLSNFLRSHINTSTCHTSRLVNSICVYNIVNFIF